MMIKRLAALFLTAMLCSPLLTSAEEVAYVTLDGRLQSRSLVTGEATDIGPLPGFVYRLAFSPTGVLYGIGREMSEFYVYSIDPDDATTTVIARLDFVERGILGFAVDSEGILWLNEASEGVVGAANKLHRFDIATGDVRTVPLEVNIWSMTFLGSRLVGVQSFTLYAIDPSTGAAEALLEDDGFILGVQGTDFDSQGGLWFNKQGAIDPPFVVDHLDAVDLATGDILTRHVMPAGTRGLAIGDTENCGGLCLRDGRFRVEAFWRDFEDRTGLGQRVVEPPPAASSDESGLLWFFDPSNWEVMVKMLDGCGTNGHYWFFAAGTTNVEFDLRVKDRMTGLVKEYTNVLGQAAPAITDTEAFATCP